jgi:hypothetical protein
MFMAHRTGFTAGTLGGAVVNAGFAAVMVQRLPAKFCLAAVGFRGRPNEGEIAMARTLLLPSPDQPAVVCMADG